MESFKPQPFEERKSQKLNFVDYTKERLFWAALPLITAGAAMLFGKVTKFKVWPLDGSPDLVSTLYAKGVKLISNKHDLKGEELEEWIKKGAWAGGLIEEFGGGMKDTLRKHYFNFVKGAEIAAPFSAYFLWNKQEGNRLDLEDAGNRLQRLQTLKPSDAELAERNEVLRKELAYANQANNTPTPMIDMPSAEHQGKVHAVHKHTARH